MIVLNYNIRGLGKKLKRSEIRNLVRKHNVDICCIQETKMEHMEVKMC